MDASVVFKDPYQNFGNGYYNDHHFQVPTPNEHTHPFKSEVVRANAWKPKRQDAHTHDVSFNCVSSPKDKW
jgi:hypothetical protein